MRHTAFRSPRRAYAWRCSPSRSRSSTASGPTTASTSTGATTGSSGAPRSPGRCTERARAVYGLQNRDAGFNDWLAGRREGAILGTVDEVVARLQRLAELGVDG